MRKRLLSAGLALVAATGIATGCGGENARLPPPPDDPAAIAAAVVEGWVICDAPHALRAMTLLERPPSDRTGTARAWVDGCREDQPQGTVTLRTRRLTSAADRARVEVQVRWEGHPVVSKQVLELRRTAAGWRVTG